MSENVLETVFEEGRARQASSERSQESEWIRASQNGNTAAFNHLVLKWEKKIFNLALRMLQDQEEAAEATQEAFLLAFRNIHRFRIDARFSTWLYRIASNRCLSRLRSRPRAPHYSLDAEEGQPLLERQLGLREKQEQRVLQRERQERVRRALSELVPDQRMVVELKIFQELKFEEIAKVVDAPVSTIKSRFYASLQVLRKSLGPLSQVI